MSRRLPEEKPPGLAKPQPPPTPPAAMRTEVMEEGRMYLAGDLTIRAYPSRRMLRIGETNFSFEFLSMYCQDCVGICFQVIKREDGIVTVDVLEAGHIVGERGLQ